MAQDDGVTRVVDGVALARALGRLQRLSRGGVGAGTWTFQRGELAIAWGGVVETVPAEGDGAAVPSPGPRSGASILGWFR